MVEAIRFLFLIFRKNIEIHPYFYRFIHLGMCLMSWLKHDKLVVSTIPFPIFL